MTVKTKIQKIKELIEEVNLSKKRVYEGLSLNCHLIEIVEEEPHCLVIRAADNDCFTIPDAIIKASQRWRLSLLVSYRYLSKEIDGVSTYPVLVIRS